MMIDPGTNTLAILKIGSACLRMRKISLTSVSLAIQSKNLHIRFSQ